jgi:DNA-binding protein Fis
MKRLRHKKQHKNKNIRRRTLPNRQQFNQDEAADMSKESIQEVVQKSLEDYFNDLGEQNRRTSMT